MSNKNLKIALGVAIAIIAVLLIALAGTRGNNYEPVTQTTTILTTTTKVPTTTQTTTQQPKAMQVSLKRLLDDYKENAVNASLKYEGKLIEITGYVPYMEKEGGEVNLILSVDPDNYLKTYEFIRCYFKDEAEIRKVAMLRSGDRATIIGKFVGKGPKDIRRYAIECKIS